MVTWHAYAKLRQHTEYTLHSFEVKTRELGEGLRHFSSKTCPAFATKDLPGEAAARARRKAADQKKCALSGKQPPKQSQDQESSPDSPKTFNLSTPKIHALGYYPSVIRWLGTTDSYSTNRVCSDQPATNKSNYSFQPELEHHRVKSFFPRTNKIKYAWQIAKLERKERVMRKYADNCQERYGTSGTTRQHGERGSSAAHHHIAAQSTRGVDLYQWVSSEKHKGDPALKV